TASTSSPTLDGPDPTAISSSAIAQLTTLAMRYEANLSVAEDLRKKAAQQQRDADRQRKIARAYVNQVVDYAMSPNSDPFAQRLSALAAAENPVDLITGVFSTEQITEAQEGHLGEAKRAFDAAQELQKRADRSTASARRSEAAAKRQLTQIGELAEDLGLGASSTPKGLPETRTEQETWNDEAVASWRTYKAQLRRLKVTTPPAKRLVKAGGS